MYYVSRLAGSGKVYITDTADGVEEYVPKKDLITLLKAGVKINGVEGHYLHMDSGNLTFEITNVYIPSDMQLGGTVSKSVADNVTADVMENGSLRRLTLTGDCLKPQRIVLGDFCTDVGMKTIQVGSLAEGSVIVFDSRIKSCHKDWVDEAAPKLRVDVTGLNEGKVLDNIWVGSAKAKYVILDEETRRHNYRCLRGMLTGYIPYPYDKSEYWEEKFIGARLGKRMLKEVNTPIQFKKCEAFKDNIVDWYFNGLSKAILRGGFPDCTNLASYVQVALTRAGASSLRLPCMYILLGGSNREINRKVKAFFKWAINVGRDRSVTAGTVTWNPNKEE